MTKNDLVIPDDEPVIVSQTLTPLLNWIRSERLHHRPDVISRCEHNRCRGERYPCDIADWLDFAIAQADALTAAQGEVERLRGVLKKTREYAQRGAFFLREHVEKLCDDALAERAEGKR